MRRPRVKRKVFLRWLLTYFALISVSIFFINSIHAIYIKRMNEDLSRLNQAYLKQVYSLFDEQFNTLDRMVYTLGLDKQFTNIIYKKKPLLAADRYDISKMRSFIGTIASSNSLIENIDFYIDEPDFLISGESVYYNNMIDLYTIKTYSMPQNEYCKLMSEDFEKKIFRLNNRYDKGLKTNKLVYLQTLPIDLKGTYKGSLMLGINEDTLDAYFENNMFPNSRILVLNEDRELIYSNDRTLYHTKTSDNMLSDKKSEISLDNTVFIKNSISTKIHNWTYVSLIPKTIYYARVNELRNRIYALTVIFFLLNILIAYYFAVVMYRPVKRIVTNIKKDGMITDQTEYDYIEKVIVDNVKAQESMKHDLQIQRQSLKNEFLFKLLSGYIKDSKYIKEQIQRFDIFINPKGYQIIMLEYDTKQEDHSEILLSQFIIRNVFEEILMGYYSIQTVDFGKRITLILNIENDSIAIEELESTLLTTTKFIKERFFLNCYIGISNIHDTLMDVQEAYRESLRAIIHVSLMDGQIIAYTRDIDKLGSQYEFTSEQEQCLINFIRTGDRERAGNIIDTIIYNNTKKQLKIDSIQCLMFDILGAIIKTGDSEVFNTMLDEKDPIRFLRETSSIEEMKQIISQVLEFACSLNAGKLQESSIKGTIDEYIKQHYSDSNLNVSLLGEAFNLTPAYLSRIYKKETGNSLLYAINAIRIEAAMELLLRTDLSVNEISERVGYYYSNAFIRFFKKHTGLTPGQYKSAYKCTIFHQ